MKRKTFRWVMADFDPEWMSAINAAGHRLVGFSMMDKEIREGGERSLAYQHGKKLTNDFVIAETAADLAQKIHGKADGAIMCVDTEYQLALAALFALQGIPCLIKNPIAMNALLAHKGLSFFETQKVKMAMCQVLGSFPNYSVLRSALERQGLGKLRHFEMTRYVPWKDTLDKNANLLLGGAVSHLVHELSFLGALGDIEDVIVDEVETRHDIPQSYSLRVKLRNVAASLRVKGGASRQYSDVYQSYTVGFSDGEGLHFDGKTVIGATVEARSISEVRAHELLMASAYFRGDRPDASFQTTQGAMNALIILESAATSAPRR